MNPERCEFMAGNVEIKIVPRVSEPTLHLIGGDVGPFEAGVPATVPLWLAIMLKQKHHCHVVVPTWLSVDELKAMLTAENDHLGLSHLPPYFFEICHMLVRDAQDDIPDNEQVKSLIKDIYDKRDAKLRTSAISFLSQSDNCHARLDAVQPLEVASSRTTLFACKKIAMMVRNKHEVVPH